MTVLSFADNLATVTLRNSSGEPFDEGGSSGTDNCAEAVRAMSLSDPSKTPTSSLSPTRRVFPPVNVPLGKSRCYISCTVIIYCTHAVYICDVLYYIVL